MILVEDKVELQNMGDPDTLEEFVSWGIKNYGAAHNGLVFWDHGDVITPYYYAYKLSNNEETEYMGAEYKVSGNLEIDYNVMVDGDYMYSFYIDDIYGDYYESDPVMFYVEGGEVGFYKD